MRHVFGMVESRRHLLPKYFEQLNLDVKWAISSQLVYVVLAEYCVINYNFYVLQIFLE